MIKVLLVDDERLALEYLEKMIDWEYYGFEVIGAALDSGKALALYKKYKPQLVISDVKMPGMNGLELVSAIREYGKETHILFLSAYKNFSYIKQAIRLDIDDYLLKSDLEEESFLKKLLNLKEKIDKENAKRKYTISMILEEIFKKKNVREESYREMLDEDDYIRIRKKYYYVILLRRTKPRFLDKYLPSDKGGEESYELEFKNICQKTGEELKVKVISDFSLNEREYIAVLEFVEKGAEDWQEQEKLKRFTAELYEKMNRETKSSFDACYDKQKRSIRQFGNFYRENKHCISESYLKQRTGVTEFPSSYPALEKEEKTPSVTADELYFMMKHKEKTRIEECLDIAETAREKEDSFTYFWYVKNFFEAFHYLEGTLADKKSGRKFTVIENSSSYDFSDAEELIKFLTDKMEEIWFILKGNKRNAYSQVTEEAIRYIRENYGDVDLTSAKVAKAVNLSAPWLSTKFKSEVGVSVNDYINQVRIAWAKKMFDEKEYMVYEVSEKTGFTSSQYFSKIFKEYVGITPNQYRRKKKNET